MSPLRHSEAARRSNPYLPSLAPSPRELSPKVTEGVFLSRTKTGDADSSLSLRPRKVRFASFPPDGENALRSLARPLTTRPTLLGSCCVKDGGYGFFAVAQNDKGKRGTGPGGRMLSAPAKSAVGMG